MPPKKKARTQAKSPKDAHFERLHAALGVAERPHRRRRVLDERDGRRAGRHGAPLAGERAQQPQAEALRVDADDEPRSSLPNFAERLAPPKLPPRSVALRQWMRRCA